MKKLALIGLLNLMTIFVFGQQLTQNIKGQIVDKVSQEPLPGATVVLLGDDKTKGAVTDADGFFKIEKVPIGRISLQVNFLGFNPVSLTNLSLTTGKEMILKIEMEENTIKTEEIVVKASRDKTKSNNEMAILSARTFTIEETQRYAGARNDVSRMASNYAGVSTANDAVNDIVIRGNSPNGLLWMFEGIEIPNPNHFGFLGATGGPVSMLNNNVLQNSDFLTAAFPAEYGNALSGVFDLKMRSGNYEKHEFLGQIGFNGFELGAEGPISKENRSSYLINYRYSTLGVLAKMGVNFGTGTAIPYYQDLSFKLNFPSRKYGNITIFGLGGKSHIDFNESSDTSSTTDNLYTPTKTNISSRSETGVIGFSHQYIYNSTFYSKLTLAATFVGNYNIVDTVIPHTTNAFPYARNSFENPNLEANLFFNKKVNEKFNFRFGITVRKMNFNLVDSVYSGTYHSFGTVIDQHGSADLIQAYYQLQYKFNEKWILNAGLHSEFLDLNNTTTLEPRFGLKWYFKPNQSLTVGYGLESHLAPILNYAWRVRLNDNTYSEPNKNLDFQKSHHFVLGYEWNISQTLHLKIESYYQYNFNSIVEQKQSAYSLLNESSFINQIPDSLKNGGTGYNYGVDFTFEKFLDNGFYFLFTTSVYNSRYKGNDGIDRPTAFDGHYVVNFLAGKEFVISRTDAKSKKVLLFDARVTSAGGQRYIPIDPVLSEKYQIPTYTKSMIYSGQFPNYFRADLRSAFRIDGRHFSQEWAIDIENLTNKQNALYMSYNFKTNSEQPINQLGFFPMVQYRIIF